jgi:hypothetical protein
MLLHTSLADGRSHRSSCAMQTLPPGSMDTPGQVSS